MTSPASSPPHIGPFCLLRRLGRGTFGEVWEVLSSKSKDRMALKVMDLSAMAKKERELAKQEAALLKRISHPHIVRFIDLLISGSQLCIVMELMDGDLQMRIRRAQSSECSILEDDIWSWCLQVSSALSYLRKERILHRDVKPSNIFLNSSSRHAVLGDLGIAKVLSSAQIWAESRIGTPSYLAPEVWNGEPYNYAADIYSLGCSLFELMELRLPFVASNEANLCAQVCRQQRPKFTMAGLHMSIRLKELVLQCLDRSPRCRPTPWKIIKYAQQLVVLGKAAVVAATLQQGLAAKQRLLSDGRGRSASPTAAPILKALVPQPPQAPRSAAASPRVALLKGVATKPAQGWGAIVPWQDRVEVGLLRQMLHEAAKAMAAASLDVAPGHFLSQTSVKDDSNDLLAYSATLLLGPLGPEESGVSAG